MPLKRKLIFLIVAVALAASAAGAYAATQTSGANSRQAFLNDVARRLHVTPAQLKNAVNGALADRLSAMVASGRLSKAQAKVMEQRLKAARGVPGAGLFAPGLMATAPHFRVLRPGQVPAPGWYAYPPGAVTPKGVPVPQLVPVPRGAPVPGAAKGPHGVQVPAPGLQAVPMPPVMFPPRALGLGLGLGMLPSGIKSATSYLGISLSKLEAEMSSGKSLAQIASAHGKTAAGLESAIESRLKAGLDKQVAAKRLTSAQAKKISSALDARVAAIVHARIGRFLMRPRFRAFYRSGPFQARPARPKLRSRGAAARLPAARFQPA